MREQLQSTDTAPERHPAVAAFHSGRLADARKLSLTLNRRNASILAVRCDVRLGDYYAALSAVEAHLAAQVDSNDCERAKAEMYRAYTTARLGDYSKAVQIFSTANAYAYSSSSDELFIEVASWHMRAAAVLGDLTTAMDLADFVLANGYRRQRVAARVVQVVNAETIGNYERHFELLRANLQDLKLLQSEPYLYSKNLLMLAASEARVPTKEGLSFLSTALTTGVWLPELREDMARILAEIASGASVLGERETEARALRSLFQIADNVETKIVYLHCKLRSAILNGDLGGSFLLDLRSLETLAQDSKLVVGDSPLSTILFDISFELSAINVSSARYFFELAMQIPLPIHSPGSVERWKVAKARALGGIDFFAEDFSAALPRLEQAYDHFVKNQFQPEAIALSIPLSQIVDNTKYYSITEVNHPINDYSEITRRTRLWIKPST